MLGSHRCSRRRRERQRRIRSHRRSSGCHRSRRRCEYGGTPAGGFYPIACSGSLRSWRYYEAAAGREAECAQFSANDVTRLTLFIEAWLKNIGTSNSKVSAALADLEKLATYHHQSVSAVTLATSKSMLRMLTDSVGSELRARGPGLMPDMTG